METLAEPLPDVARYLDHHRQETADHKLPEFESILRHISRFRTITEDSRLLEIGIGTGWIPILCKKRGLSCKGLEISQELVDYARDFGRENGVELDLAVGNVETDDLGTEVYDAIIAKNTFEHVEHWREGLRRVYEALKPGGVFYFTSVNKFSLYTSGEYDFPFYSWMPNLWRYRLRIARQGPDIMKLGIDFNEFTYGQLRRAFKRLGFSRVMDRIDCMDGQTLAADSMPKRLALRLLRARPIKDTVLLFASHTSFTCVK